MSAARSAIAPLRHQLTVDAPPADAFAAFTAGIHAWWPRESTWSGSLVERVAIEPRAGGFCYEIGPQGRRLDWGRVEAWEPPNRVSFAWLIAADRRPEPSPAQASRVEVVFIPTGEGRTRVELTHDGWERHGLDGAAYRDAFAAAGAWPAMLKAYATTVARRAEAPWDGLTT